MALGDECVTASVVKTPRERAADRVSIVTTVVGLVVVVLDLVWLARVALAADESDTTWCEAADSLGAWFVWGAAAVVMTLVAAWFVVVAVRHRGEHLREISSVHRSYVLATGLLTTFGLLTGSLPAVLVAAVGFGVVMAAARRGVEQTVQRRVMLRILGLVLLMFLTLALTQMSLVWSFAAVGSEEASAPAREAWVDNHLQLLTLTSRAVALVLALAYVVVVVTGRAALATVAVLRLQLGFLGFAVAAVSALAWWIVPPVVVLVGALSMLTVRRVPPEQRLAPVVLNGRAAAAVDPVDPPRAPR